MAAITLNPSHSSFLNTLHSILNVILEIRKKWSALYRAQYSRLDIMSIMMLWGIRKIYEISDFYPAAIGTFIRYICFCLLVTVKIYTKMGAIVKNKLIRHICIEINKVRHDKKTN